ncbi:MAG: 50S ribosomal protein L11 methyltransferase [Desulfobacteraceae bacterium]|nr:50S ribosomal protein L11 methyltransferase [Desulfobacteraceae bacterium]
MEKSFDETVKYFRGNPYSRLDWPVRLSERVVVAPSYGNCSAGENELVIRIDPGMAFGTGTHPTTALCMNLIEEHLKKGDHFLDVGTGSGILGIAAARLGASRVLGLDIDPDALEAAARNLEQNRVGGIMEVGATPVDRVEETFEVVVANLTATLHTQMSTSLANRVGERGWLLLGGILDEQMEEVVDSFRHYEFRVVESRSAEEWRAILLRRN